MLPPFIPFGLDFEVKFRLLRLSLFLSDLNSTILLLHLFSSKVWHRSITTNLTTRSFIKTRATFQKNNIFVYHKSLKRMVKSEFWVHKLFLNLCSHALNSQRLFYSKKAGVKCSYQIFLVTIVRIKALWNCKRRNKGKFTSKSHSNKIMLCGDGGQHYLVLNKISTL